MRPIQKTIYTLNLDMAYEPVIWALTLPFIENYARKIQAKVFVITERKFETWPPVMEKLQIYDLGRANKSDWHLFCDADTLISPEFFDLTQLVAKDTVLHNGKDFGCIRWSMDDPYFLRDGRWLGSCDWFTMASDWCLDLWRPPDDLTLEEATKRISLTIEERLKGQMEPSHLIDDYLLSRNIARFGLKFTTVGDIVDQLRGNGHPRGLNNPYLWHQYNMPTREKAQKMLAILSTPKDHPAFHKRGKVQNTPAGPVMEVVGTGEIIQACGVGWQLISQQDAETFRNKWELND